MTSALSSEAMLNGARPDASDDEVAEAANTGQLHPRTNLSHVFEVAFRPRLDADETSVTFMPGQVSAGPHPVPGGRMPDHQSGWILFTSQAIRWHLMVEGMPGQAALLDPFPEVPRMIEYERINEVYISRSSASPLRGQADSTMFLIVHDGEHAGDAGRLNTLGEEARGTPPRQEAVLHGWRITASLSEVCTSRVLACAVLRLPSCP